MLPVPAVGIAENLGRVDTTESKCVTDYQAEASTGYLQTQFLLAPCALSVFRKVAREQNFGIRKDPGVTDSALCAVGRLLGSGI